MATATFATAALSRTGGRETNQDASGFRQAGDACCWALADGLGGHRGGEIASRVAVDAALASFERNPACTAEALEAHFSAAQRAVLEEQGRDPALAEMRTTLALLVSDGRAALWGHIGDSRLYRFENGAISAQTVDHSVPQAMAAAGEIAPEEIRFHEDRNRLLRCLGKDGDLKPAILAAPVTLGRGDAFLLASDGFWEYVNEVEMEADFAKSREPGEWLHRLEGRLLPRGREGQDNYTAVAVLYLGGNALPAAPATTPLPTTRRDPAATSSAHLPLAIAALTVLTIAVLGLAVARLKPEWLALRRDARLPVANYQQASAVPAGVVYRPDTRTTYPTLSQALREAAAEGGRLWLGPGVYRDLPRTLPAGLQLAGADERSTTLELTEHPLELTGGAGALAHLRIQAGPKLETALRIAGDFHGTVERVSLEGGGKSALLVVVEGGAHPKLVDNVFIPAPGGRCASGIELPAGNTCRSDETSFTPQPRPKRKPKSPPPPE